MWKNRLIRQAKRERLLELLLAICLGVVWASASIGDGIDRAGVAGPPVELRSTGKLEISGPADFSDLIEVVRPLKNRPPVSAELVKAIRNAISRLPKSIVALLRAHGTRIYITPTLACKEPGLKNREGRGYDGYTLRSCPGMFRHHAIYVCERTLDETDESVKSARPAYEVVDTFYHECGHAIDSYMGDLSLSQEFKHMYRLDAARMDVDEKGDLAYYLQKAETGQQECCAELIGIILGKRSDNAERMKRSFPNCVTFLTRKLELDKR